MQVRPYTCLSCNSPPRHLLPRSLKFYPVYPVHPCSNFSLRLIRNNSREIIPHLDPQDVGFRFHCSSGVVMNNPLNPTYGLGGECFRNLRSLRVSAVDRFVQGAERWSTGCEAERSHQRDVTPAKAGVQALYSWIPACAGITALRFSLRTPRLCGGSDKVKRGAPAPDGIRKIRVIRGQKGLSLRTLRTLGWNR